MPIDLNADLGEAEGGAGLALDLALLEIVTSANVACGFHAGDAARMQAVCAAAARHGVRTGAQVSYRDREGFGRRDMDVPSDQLRADVLDQIGALDAFGDVAYVKPHGALYNRVVHDDRQARAVVKAVAAYGKCLPLVGLPGSRLLELARTEGLPVVEEGFTDRAYSADGRLVPRNKPGAVLTKKGAVLQQALQLAKTGRVRTLCVHGDTPGALSLARRIRSSLEQEGFTLLAFA